MAQYDLAKYNYTIDLFWLQTSGYACSGVYFSLPLTNSRHIIYNCFNREKEKLFKASENETKYMKATRKPNECIYCNTIDDHRFEKVSGFIYLGSPLIETNEVHDGYKKSVTKEYLLLLKQTLHGSRILGSEKTVKAESLQDPCKASRQTVSYTHLDVYKRQL